MLNPIRIEERKMEGIKMDMIKEDVRKTTATLVGNSFLLSKDCTFAIFE